MSSLIKYWPMLAFFLGLLIQLATAWICWSLRQLAKNEVKVLVDEAVARLVRADSEFEQDLDDHEGRITRVEKDVEAIRDNIADLPTKSDLARVEGELKGLGRQLDSIERGHGRLEGYFLQLGVEKTQ